MIINEKYLKYFTIVTYVALFFSTIWYLTRLIVLTYNQTTSNYDLTIFIATIIVLIVTYCGDKVLAYGGVNIKNFFLVD